jgi:hypothetical protein
MQGTAECNVSDYGRWKQVSYLIRTAQKVDYCGIRDLYVILDDYPLNYWTFNAEADRFYASLGFKSFQVRVSKPIA